MIVAVAVMALGLSVYLLFVELFSAESFVKPLRSFLDTAIDSKRRETVYNWRDLSKTERQAMSTIDFEPLIVAVPLWEESPGVFRVGKSRVLLELVLRAFKRGETPEGIVRSYRTLQLADVYAVISRYLADRAPFDEYLRRCDQDAEAIRCQVEAIPVTWAE